MSDPLVTYLNDHMAGAGVAIDLLHAMQDRHEDEPLGQFAANILIAVEEDEATLRSIAKNLGCGSNIFKETAAWVTEKVSRMKLGTGSSGAFGTFEALEFLSLGIQGKLSLWRALQVVSATDTRLSGFDYEELISRAEAQYSNVEERRLFMAEDAFKQQHA